MDTITGTVSRVNGKGFQIAELDGWLNISKYASPAPTMPTVGERVNITIDKSGFVRKIEPIAKPATPPESGPAPAPTSSVDRETAKGELMKQVAETYRVNLAEEVVRLERERKEVLEQKALNILTSVIQRSARAHVGDVTTSVVPLLDEDLKGKIIGREGRNIRAF